LKKRKAELEKRIFVLFFIMTFLLVLLLIFIEWELAKFGINKYEDHNIQHTLSELKIAQTEMMTEKQYLLQNLETDSTIITALKNKNYNLIEKYIETIGTIRI